MLKTRNPQGLRPLPPMSRGSSQRSAVRAHFRKGSQKAENIACVGYKAFRAVIILRKYHGLHAFQQRQLFNASDRLFSCMAWREETQHGWRGRSACCGRWKQTSSVESEVLDVSDSNEAPEASAAALLHQATDVMKCRFLEHRIGGTSIAVNPGNVRVLGHTIRGASIAVNPKHPYGTSLV